MKVRVKKLNELATLPTKGSEFAAGSDLYACLNQEVVIASGDTVPIPTGIAMELPVGTVGLVYARSGLATKRNLAPANKVGVIDCDYRGEIMVALHNHGSEPQTIAKNERIAQIVITPYYEAEFEENGELEPSKRGSGGFGSTDKELV